MLPPQPFVLKPGGPPGPRGSCLGPRGQIG